MIKDSLSADPLVLVPADRFFMQLVSLDSSVPAADQVALALEELSPFPLVQMYHGFVADAAGTRALAFAAYRRRFSAEEQAAWPTAAAVVPDILALLVPVPTGPAIVVHATPDRLLGAAWDGQNALPVAVQARVVVGDPADAEAMLVAELKRAGAPAGAKVSRLEGPIAAGWNDRDEAVFRLDGRDTLHLPPAALAAADVRDKSFLEEKQFRRKQDRRWWGAAVAVAGMLAIAMLLDLAGAGYALWNHRDRSALALHASEVRGIEAAQTMAVRIEQLSERQQRPLEWLSAIGAIRPRSMQFTRVVGRNDRTLEIEAQTTNANDVGVFEAALRKLPNLDHVEMRDLRAREGMTSFVVALAFKPVAATAAAAGEGQP
jgi:hypothetical protein